VRGGDERIGELSDLRSNRKVGVHESSFACRLWLVTPAAKKRDQRQHEERQQSAVLRQHSVAWWLIGRAGMQIITP
jgi:hypothetical protein